MRWFRWLSGALLGFVLLGPPGWAGAPPLFLTRDPEALRLVDRLVARGLLPIEYSVTRMFDRDRLADRLEELGESAELSQAERDRIAALVPYLRLEEETFRIETEPPMAGAITATGELLLQTRWMQGEKRGLAGMGIARLTNRNPFFGVHAEFGWGTLTDLDFAPTPLDVAQTFQTFEFLPEEALNRSLGYLSLGGESASLLIGKFDLAWGSGRNGTLFLSENTDAKSGLLFSARSGPLHMEALTVSLPHEGTDTYLSAHRLDVRPHRRMLLSAYEGMVYKDRIELNYVNPFAVYLLLYPQLDRTRREAGPGGVGDNAIIGGAFTLIPIDGMIVFADLLVDDIQPRALKSWDTKFAVQWGLHWFDPLGLRDWDLRAEYVFVNPWNYTHEIEGLNFAIFDRPVGYRLGPDAESLWLEGSRALRRNVRVGGVLFRDRKGEVQIGTVHRKDDPSEWEYLFGTIETQRGLKLFGEWTHWGRGHLRLEIGWRWVRNRDHQPNVHEDGPLVQLQGRVVF